MNPRTAAALADVIEAGGTLGLEHRALVTLCRALEAELIEARRVLGECRGWVIPDSAAGKPLIEAIDAVLKGAA